MSRNESFYHGTAVAPDQMGGRVKPPGGWENLNSIFAFHDTSGSLREIVPSDPPEVRDQNLAALKEANPEGHEWAMKQANEGRPAYAARDSDDAWRWAGTKAGKTGTPYVYEVAEAPDTEPDAARPDDWVLSEGGFEVTGVNNTKPPMVSNWSVHNSMMEGQMMDRLRRQREERSPLQPEQFSSPSNGPKDELDDLLGL